MTDFDYKQYSLENLENWLHDAISSGEATPQEIYDTIKKVVQEEYYYHKDGASKTNELLTLLNGHREVSFSFINDTTNLGYKPTFTACDANDTSPECKSSWNSFWNDDKINFTTPYVSEDGDVWNQDKIREYNLREAEYYDKRAKLDLQQDKVTKWVLPVELDGLTGDCVVTLPDDLLERVGWVEGDTVEFVSNPNGSFTVKKVVKSEV